MRADLLQPLTLAGLVLVCGVVAAVLMTRTQASRAGLAAGQSAADGGPAGPAPPGSSSAGAPAPSVWVPKWDTEEIPSWKVGVPMRPMDRDIVAVILSGHVERTSMLDLFPDRPYQVRLAGSAALNQFRFVLIDLNRDGKWDEKWDLGEAGQIHRQVMHDPDSAGQEVNYTLAHGRWQPH